MAAAHIWGRHGDLTISSSRGSGRSHHPLYLSRDANLIKYLLDTVVDIVPNLIVPKSDNAPA